MALRIPIHLSTMYWYRQSGLMLMVRVGYPELSMLIMETLQKLRVGLIRERRIRASLQIMSLTKTVIFWAGLSQRMVQLIPTIVAGKSP